MFDDSHVLVGRPVHEGRFQGLSRPGGRAGGPRRKFGAAESSEEEKKIGRNSLSNFVGLKRM